MRFPRPEKIVAVLTGAVCILSGGTLRAIEVYGASGTSATYTTAPSNDFGFENVAQVYDTVDTFYTSGVYLGNGWMLGAYHEVRSDNNGTGGFAFGPVYLDGTAYSVNASTATRITDPTTGEPADLAMYQLTTIPDIPNLKTFIISSAVPPNNAALKMMGNGFARDDSLSYWEVNTGSTPWVWSGTQSTGNYSGYLVNLSTSAQALRWGNGTWSGTESGNDGYGVTSFFYSLFENSNDSAMAAGGDSGGGVFYESGGTWQLSGIMLTVSALSGQPANTSIVGTTQEQGNATFAAELAHYSTQINSVAFSPEITTVDGSQTVTIGQSVTFAVNAIGGGTLTYQWYYNGAAISGATGSSYTIASVTLDNAGSYTVVATDPYGTATSSAYTLTVNTPVPSMPHWALATLPLLLAVATARALRNGPRRGMR